MSSAQTKDNVVSWRKGDILQCVAFNSPIKKVNHPDYLLVMGNPGVYTNCYNLSTGVYISELYHLFSDDLFELRSRLDEPPEDDYMVE